MRFAVLLVAFLASGAQAQDCRDQVSGAEIRAKGQVMRQCLTAQVRLLNRSGDQARDVATAAMIACRDRLEGILAVGDGCWTPRLVRMLRARFQREFHDVAVAESVRLRAR